jgi:D-amino-acid dehydrogenase
MKIAVIGAGIIGITTAYELARDGHSVTVLERRGAAAEETSFANAGIVAPGYVTPWAAPGMPQKVLMHLLSRYAPVKLGLPLSTRELAWIWRWYRACNPQTYLATRTQLQRLAFYSRERLHQITAERKLDYDRSDGYMVLLRAPSDRDMVQMSLQVLRDAGVAFTELDAAGARRIEPALHPETPLHGAIHLPGDEVGNCRQFCLMLKAESQALGVGYLFNTAVARIAQAGRPGTCEVTIAGEAASRAFDAVVMCAGLASAQLLRPLGLKIPMAAVYGYSLSAPIRDGHGGQSGQGNEHNAPISAIMDERYKVAISRLGNRVRVAGSAELGGTPQSQRESSIQTLYKVLRDWFPGAVAPAGAVQIWKGARPMLPDGPPVIGPSGVPGLWLNLGHGSSGWALSCGSARALADVLGNRAPGLDMSGFSVARYAS